MPVLSLGSMRFQQSWDDLPSRDIDSSSQNKLEEILRLAVRKGFHHVETARHYGTSELQLGWALRNVPDSKRLLQTKVPPRQDPHIFERELELSFKNLQCDYLHLLAIHGLNHSEHLEQTLRPGGCMEVVRQWQSEGRIGHVGFSTHGRTDFILKVIETDQFDYVNLHWYYINQDNSSAIQAAKDRDLGVFIISPTDKGGHLHTPSSCLEKLCSPLPPIVFNDLFCLANPLVHTISVGLACPGDIDNHLEAVKLLPQANQLVAPIHNRLTEAARLSLGDDWLGTWRVGLPSWEDTPGGINLTVLLWLHNLIESWEMENFAKARYSLLGNGGHWFPGENADLLDKEVSQRDLEKALEESPWGKEIPLILRKLKKRLGGGSKQRLGKY
ncbi:aldo/keto reductase [Prochlorococcus sp. MIT 1341]|uniref:aldo/keto reductase n=1 Tax=Prochlorococcus sp. MIT 1341 TaxID=3096221 RepID=UPI0039BEF9BF